MALNGVLTYWELSYPEDAFEKFLLELQEYLKSKFKPVLKVDGDAHMNTRDVTRKLRDILSADVQGYIRQHIRFTYLPIFSPPS